MSRFSKCPKSPDKHLIISRTIRAFKRHFLRKSGNFRQGKEVTDAEFPHFHIYSSYNSQKQNLKMF